MQRGGARHRRSRRSSLAAPLPLLRQARRSSEQLHLQVGYLGRQHTLCICSALLGLRTSPAAACLRRGCPRHSVCLMPELQPASASLGRPVLMYVVPSTAISAAPTLHAGGPPPGFAEPGPHQPPTASSSSTAGICNPAVATAAAAPGTSGAQAQSQTQDKQPEARPREQAGAVQRNQSQVKSKLLERLADEVSETTPGPVMCLPDACRLPGSTACCGRLAPCRQAPGLGPCCLYGDVQTSVQQLTKYGYPASS